MPNVNYFIAKRDEKSGYNLYYARNKETNAEFFTTNQQSAAPFKNLKDARVFRNQLSNRNKVKFRLFKIEIKELK